MARRSYGTGSLTIRRGKWFGQWRVGQKKIGRVIGPVRQPSTREGLTRSQAECELRRLIESEAAPIPIQARVTIEEAGKQYVSHAEAMGRRRSTTKDYESTLRVHLTPFFAGMTLDKIEPADIERFMAQKRREDKATKSILNYLILLQSILTFAQKRGWLRGENPCRFVDKPRAESTDPDVHFLDQAELEAVLGVEPEHDFDPMLRVMYLTAAMSGLRLGECRGLRWRDVDWVAGRIRVRQTYVRGEVGVPKSRRSSRSVPLADRLAGELEHQFQRSDYQEDDALVFGNPQTGKAISASFVEQRFRWALGKAEVRRVRFHDLRHTFGTRMAGAGVPMRTLQEWMGHRDFKTTLIYADYQPSEHEADFVQRAFPQQIGDRLETANRSS
jgi:integrase